MVDSITIEQYPKVMKEFIKIDREIKTLQKAIVMTLLKGSKPTKKELKETIINRIYKIFEDKEEKVLDLIQEGFKDLILLNESEAIYELENRNKTKYMKDVKNEIEKYQKDIKKSFLLKYNENKKSTAVECYRQVARVLSYNISKKEMEKILNENK